jgi:predicted MFS family arabinose efflux permease
MPGKRRVRPGLLLFLFSLCGLAATVSSRSIDPLVAVLAADFGVPTATAALVTSLYALPFALGQPILGPLGDAFGKTRMLRFYLWILATCLLATAFTTDLHALLFFRFCSGFAAGGIIPACMASLGDRFAGSERAIAISRFVTVGLIAQILSASLSGVLASFLGWRSVFVAASLIATVSALSATFFLKMPIGQSRPFSFPEAVRNYKSVFANPKAPLCFATVFLEGIALFGITPYVSELLRVEHLGDVREAGLVIGAMGVGGIVYSFVLPMLLKRVTRFTLLGTGGMIAAAAPLALAFASSWIAIAGAFAIAGFGYMLMHNSIQSEAVELAPDSRVSAYSMHAFSFFTGQSLGPILAGGAMHAFGSTAMLMCSAAVLAATGLIIARLFIRLAKAA